MWYDERHQLPLTVKHQTDWPFVVVVVAAKFQATDKGFILVQLDRCQLLPIYWSQSLGQYSDLSIDNKDNDVLIGLLHICLIEHMLKIQWWPSG